MNYFVFDIETIPDIEAGRRLYGLQELGDEEVLAAMQLQRREENGSDFLRLTLQKIVCISVLLRHQDQLKVWSLGEPGDDEASLIRRFFAGLERFTPTLISWNGQAFDLPVLSYRALRWRIDARAFWDQGEDNKEFRYNNYVSRYHQRHIDLMDLLSLYQGRATVPLDHIATLLGFPGKLGMSGQEVWPAWQRGDIAGIRAYCETDVMNTWLVFLRFQLLRGHFSADQVAAEEALLRGLLTQSEDATWREFFAAWTVAKEEGL